MGYKNKRIKKEIREMADLHNEKYKKKNFKKIKQIWKSKKV